MQNLTAKEQEWLERFKVSSDLKGAPAYITSSKNFMLEAVKFEMEAFKFASEELRAERDMLMKVVAINAWSLKYASKELQNDKELVMLAVQEMGWLLKFASKELQDDKEVVISAIQEMRLAFKFASKRLQDDKEIVILVVQDYGALLEYASKRLRADKEVIKIAIASTKYAKKFAIKADCDDEFEIAFEIEKLQRIENNTFVQKMQYAQKIALGEIDPSDVDFIDFKKQNQLYEQDYKAMYSQIMNEGKINLSDNSIDELKQVATIFSGTEYLGNEDYSIILNEFTDEKRIDKINPLIERVILEKESNATDYNDFMKLAEYSYDMLKETQKVKKYYKAAEEKIETFDNALQLANAIVSIRNDELWATDVYRQAYKLIENVEDIMTLADFIYGNGYLNDKDWWIRLIEEYASKIDSFDESLTLLRRVANNILHDYNFFIKIVDIIRPYCKNVSHYIYVIQECISLISIAKELFIEAIPLIQNDNDKVKLINCAEYLLEDKDLKNEIANSSIEELKSKYTKPNKSKLNKLYAAAIRSGEIDPVKINFDTYVKVYVININHICMDFEELIDEAFNNNDQDTLDKYFLTSVDFS